MLELKNIVKCYSSGEAEVRALNGVSLKFRKNEFVSILGKSGCGKTTMLNIIGGLDRYTSGDLIINGKSTKQFKDFDWDVYRNHSIGFVFQSYNLIPHQTVLANVELALTLSGVSKAERRTRAIAALEKVGLGDQIKKKPNQMSGGQMQRVAIARALVNDPDILLADEPTGALDSHTSLQIMEILKEVAQDKLVIMVTHNPDLANDYSTRIVQLSDGEVIDDTNPYEGEEIVEKESELISNKGKKDKNKSKGEKTKKKSMSFPTALSLSFNNLLTKKARTILTSFAGSIGIIGIALILSLSNGIQAYIDQVQEDTLSTYPLTIQKETQDYTAMLTAMTNVSEATPESIDPNTIYVDDSMGEMITAMMSTVSNDMKSFKAYLDENYSDIENAVSDVQYTYDFDLQVFTEDGKVQVSPTEIFDNMGESFAGISEMMGTMGGLSVMSEMINNQDLLDQQYELVGEGSHWPEEANEIVLVVNKNNQISKMTLYMLGILPQEELADVMDNLLKNKEYESVHMQEYSLDEFLGKKFYMLNTSDFFEKTDRIGENGLPIWDDVRDDFLTDDEQAKFVTSKGTELVISGIVRPREGVSATSISGALGYTKELTDLILEMNRNSEVINQQKANPEYNVIEGVKFEKTKYTPQTIGTLLKMMDPTKKQQFYNVMTSQIITNPEYSKLLVVDSNESFMYIFAMMPAEIQNAYIAEMFEAAKADQSNTEKLSTLFGTLTSMSGGIEVNSNNFLALLPSLREIKIPMGEMSINLIMMSLTDIPANPQAGVPEIKGLMSLAGETKMTSLYADMAEQVKKLTVNDELFELIVSSMTEDDPNFLVLEEMLYGMASTDETHESILKKLGDAEQADPMSINFYAKDFESKDTIESFISDYNKKVKADGEKEKEIQYTDLIGVMMSSVSLIINVISYVLIAFVSISLVVSSIMIGIITYISVLERTKEIGILRSIGASKKDISRVFNAETLIVGLVAGLIGIIFTVLLCLPINAIIHALSGIYSINAVLPWAGGLALVIISMVLTFIAGLIPSRIAAKKDPVEALRTE